MAIPCIATTLYDQMSAYNPTIIPSSWYAPDGLDGDTYSWDNFLLPFKSDVRGVTWVGGGAAITGVTIRFYRGLPASPDYQPLISALPESETSSDYLKGYQFNLSQLSTVSLGGGLTQYHANLQTPLRLVGNKVYWIKIEGDCVSGNSWGLATATHGRDSMHFRFITGWVFQRITGSLAFQLDGTSYIPSPVSKGG